jgi:hypothetical protein
LNQHLAHMAEADRAIPLDAMRLRRNRVCPLCSNVEEAWFASRGRHMRRCKACGFIWVAEGLKRDAKGQSIYQSDKPIFFEEGNEEYYLGPVGYILSRLSYFYNKGLIGGVLRLGRYALCPFRERHLYINPHDVLVLIAVEQSSYPD